MTEIRDLELHAILEASLGPYNDYTPLSASP